VLAVDYESLKRALSSLWAQVSDESAEKEEKDDKKD